MRSALLVVIGMALAVGAVPALAATGSDTVTYTQYVDGDTALEEVRRGTLDIHYWGIPVDRLADDDSRNGLDIYESTLGSYSLLLNPADTDTFNPFSIREVRFAINYMVDRDYIVDDILYGKGHPMISPYNEIHPDYIAVAADLAAYNISYDPARAISIIHEAMIANGAVLDGVWKTDDSTITLNVFIRNDDQVRKSVGEILAGDLEKAGFDVNRIYGDLTKALVDVYGSDPADLGWHVYTEGWANSDFSRYDSVLLSRMYAPWFTFMPGSQNQDYWNYENERLDNITRAIFSADFDSPQERDTLIRQAVGIGMEDAVRLFLFGDLTQYVASADTEGIVNDFGVGIPSRFTAINARTADGQLDIGVKQIYQGSWNPVAGYLDWYSQYIWHTIMDPAVTVHPYSGTAMPVRAEWTVETPGNGEAVPVHPDAVTWDSEIQDWVRAGQDVEAQSLVTYDFAMGDWHHGIPMDMADIMYNVYFIKEWGSASQDDDATHDPEYTSRTQPLADSIVAVRAVDGDTLEVYVDYWHFDEGEIAKWTREVWPSTPWEIGHAMERAVLDGQAAYSRTVSSTHNIPWLSLVIPNDAEIVAGYIDAANPVVPASIENMVVDATSRYGAADLWISDTGHAVISNGPYTLVHYLPEARTITTAQFIDDSYPFDAGHWSALEDVQLPSLRGVFVPTLVSVERDLEIRMDTLGVDKIDYFVVDSRGEVALAGAMEVDDGLNTLIIDAARLGTLQQGAANLHIIASSHDILWPDSHTGGFFVLDGSP